MNNEYDGYTKIYNIQVTPINRSLMSPSYTNKRPLIIIDGTEISIYIRINFNYSII